MTARVAIGLHAGVLPDGIYEAMVVDVESGSGAVGSFGLDLAVIGGAHKGEVVALQVAGWAVDELDLLGLPVTVTVRNGVPTVERDDHDGA